MFSGTINALGIGVAFIPALTKALGSTTASIGLQSTKYTSSEYSATQTTVEY